ncbi:MAG: hypothetical protein CMH45_09115 [Muricauda sp.]|nr:hypothetical protein [Allomuricauda sp.]
MRHTALPDGADHTVLYIARGLDNDAGSKIARFVRSYTNFNAGLDHHLCVIVKGYSDEETKRRHLDLFSGTNHSVYETGDDDFDVGAYASAAKTIKSRYVCLLNTNSQIMSNNWLAKLAVNLTDEVGIVGATGSFEALRATHPDFPSFPNIHIRSNGLLIRREHAVRFLPERVSDKMAAWRVESGLKSLTRHILDLGLTVLVVGRNGRGYAPSEWPVSCTFRQGLQENVLIHDNQTRSYEVAHYQDKIHMSKSTWGPFSLMIENKTEPNGR